MRRHLSYLWYVLRHKWFVFVEGMKLGVPLYQLIVHDWSKFLPSEWLPYARNFYNEDGSVKDTREESESFLDAWNHHQKRNRHHWQYWVSIQDSGEIILRPIPRRFIKEMLADWRGAGKARHSPNTWEWYEKNRFNMLLHPEARWWIETELGEQYEKYLIKTGAGYPGEVTRKRHEWLDRCMGQSPNSSKSKGPEEYARYYFDGWKARYSQWFNQGGPLT